MAQFHFVEDYEKLVKRLVRDYPIDEAMAYAVGGHYDIFGQIEAHLLRSCGLADGMRLVDLGCGSGRLPTQLHRTMRVAYIGIDIVQDLLDYAESKAPGYQFILHRGLTIPQPDGLADMVSAFSLFTHLLHEETFTYLEESRRILKPGGRAVFSFLEFAEPSHWETFAHTVKMRRAGTVDHLNTFIERGAIELWARQLGFEVERFVDSTHPVFDGHRLGQSTAVLRKPA